MTDDTPRSRTLSRRSVLGFGAVGLLGLTASGCTHPYSPYRYRFTLDVEASGRKCTGSSVCEVRPYRFDFALNGVAGGIGTVGEATVVDLGSDRLLLALLTGDGLWFNTPTALIMSLYQVPPDGGNHDRGYEFISNLRGPKEVPLNELPRLISFRDRSDPRTLFEVDPNDLGASLGIEAQIFSATIEITDAAVTHDIIHQLPWLKRFKYGYNIQDGSAGCTEMFCVTTNQLLGDRW